MNPRFKTRKAWREVTDAEDGPTGKKQLYWSVLDSKKKDRRVCAKASKDEAKRVAAWLNANPWAADMPALLVDSESRTHATTLIDVCDLDTAKPKPVYNWTNYDGKPTVMERVIFPMPNDDFDSMSIPSIASLNVVVTG